MQKGLEHCDPSCFLLLLVSQQEGDCEVQLQWIPCKSWVPNTQTCAHVFTNEKQVAVSASKRQQSFSRQC
eukprot:381241-Amphidinium_carterae.1